MRPIIAACIMLAVVAGCKQVPRKEPPGAATQTSYVRYFGDPIELGADRKKQVDAYVAFGPAPSGGNLVPIPIFVVVGSKPESSIAKATIRTFFGDSFDDLKSRQLVPDVVAVSFNGDTARVDLKLLTALADRRFPAALLLGLRQVSPVTAVEIFEGGERKLRFDGAPDTIPVVEPGPPRMVNIFKVNREDIKGFEEYNIYFDRPVRMTRLDVQDAAGRPVDIAAMETVFNLMVALRFKDPKSVVPGSAYRLLWAVEDAKGRTSSGEKIWHP